MYRPARNIKGIGRSIPEFNKITIAPTLAMSNDFWSRPELRFYVTRANWNEAAANANAGLNNTGFGAYKRQAQTLAGVQYEVWW